MMVPPSSIIRDWLIQNQLGSQDGDWKVFVSYLPEDPARAIAVYDTTPKDDGRISTGERIQHPGVEILVRGSAYLETFMKMYTIASGLDQIRGFASRGYKILNVTRVGGVHYLGEDVKSGQRRFLVSLNAILTLIQGD